MRFIPICTEAEITRAAHALIEGHLVAFPTETVYGLGADASNKEAINRIYDVKSRPRNHPLIIHISSVKQLNKWAVNVPEQAIKIAKKFWPGPLTLILERSPLAKDFITGGQHFVALRVPSHPIAKKLIETFENLGGLGIAAPSANIYGKVSPTSAEAVKIEIGDRLRKDDFILNGNRSEIGLESTIISFIENEISIVRPGYITIEKLYEDFGHTLKLSKKDINLKTPGNSKSHYSPNAKVRINGDPVAGEGLIATSNIETPQGVIRLSTPHTLEEFAHELYEAFRLADKLKLKSVVVKLPEERGLGIAIMNRVKQASYRAM
jgi:L-threonylcarbamoyladenylate synthase